MSVFLSKFNDREGIEEMKKLILCLCIFTITLMPIRANTKEDVQLSKCVDGDTTHFIVQGEHVKVRYLAMNAPEYTKEKEPYGKEASSYVCDILTNANRIELEYDDGSDMLDKYGRTLAWVYADGTLIQKELVKQGLAEVKYIYGDYAYTDELKQLERDAKKNRLGMWSEVQKEDTSDTAAIISTVTGVVLIAFGVIFAKGKRNKTRFIKKGMKEIKRGK